MSLTPPINKVASIFVLKIWNGPNRILQGQGETDLWTNLKSKISCQTPYRYFLFSIIIFLLLFSCFYPQGLCFWFVYISAYFVIVRIVCKARYCAFDSSMGFVNVRVVARLGCRNVPQFLFRLIVNGFKYWVKRHFYGDPTLPPPPLLSFVLQSQRRKKLRELSRQCISKIPRKTDRLGLLLKIPG